MSCLSVLLIALKARVCLVFVLARLKLEKVGLLTKEYESFCPDLVVQGCNPATRDMEAGEESIKALAVEDLETSLHKLTGPALKIKPAKSWVCLSGGAWQPVRPVVNLRNVLKVYSIGFKLLQFLFRLWVWMLCLRALRVCPAALQTGSWC